MNQINSEMKGGSEEELSLAGSVGTTTEGAAAIKEMGRQREQD